MLRRRLLDIRPCSVNSGVFLSTDMSLKRFYRVMKSFVLQTIWLLGEGANTDFYIAVRKVVGKLVVLPGVLPYLSLFLFALLVFCRYFFLWPYFVLIHFANTNNPL